ncbi:MAG: polyprenyl synthetase family protein, partial [Sciscionella sp.]
MTATLPEPITEARDLVAPALRASVARLAAPMRRIAEYHFGWRDADGTELAGNGGKALRPALALLGARAVGADPQCAVPAAVAIELVHNFSLLHDDVMDGDETRRHRLTAWRVFGMPAAILAGDALLTLAVETARTGCAPEVAGEVIGCLDESVQRLIIGQSSDVDFESRRDVGLQECLRMAADKTGALMRAAMSIGALAAGADSVKVAALAEFGEHLGLAFQLVDDLLGIWGSPEVTGKPALADLASRKKSVPVVAALNSATPAGKSLGESYFSAAESDQQDLERMAELVEQAGGLSYTESEAQRHLQAARLCL